MTSQPLVRHSGNRLITTSLAISNHFNKKHSHILRDIENLECSQQFRKSNFGLSSYTTSQNKSLPMYEITRDGFVFLCMGFTGATAAQWKEKYIAAFNTLEAEISRRQDVLTDERTLHLLRAAYLNSKPEMAELVRYYGMGLKHIEIGKLMGMNPGSISYRLKKLNDLGFVQYQPNPELSERGKLGHAAMMEKRAQQSLSLEG